MWWLDPKDASTFAIDDQFAVGDDIIIAPVVERSLTIALITSRELILKDFV